MSTKKKGTILKYTSIILVSVILVILAIALLKPSFLPISNFLTKKDLPDNEIALPAFSTSIIKDKEQQLKDADKLLSNVRAFPIHEATIEQVNDGSLPVITNATSELLVVNKERQLPVGYKPNDLVKPKVPFSFNGEDEKMYLRKVAAEALEELFYAAAEENIHLFAVSGFRSYERQDFLYHYYVSTIGEEEAARASAYPGTSEHQTGLAMDISSASNGFRLTKEFGETAEGKWVAENAHRFGYIIRYPEDKEEITGYKYEPWHLRYVGKDAAAYIKNKGLTLEEVSGKRY